MIRLRNSALRRALVAPVIVLASIAPVALPAVAQEVAPPPTPNADRLADEMRVLARDPRNVRSLVTAGELSARLNDPSAAAGFFARAQALEPGNPRVRAGQAMVMVRMERPGEALRLFAEAARAGLDMEPYASDRALAYDLIGAQAHAQRDHRIAMRGNPDDETRRRYALSLGISGDKAQAQTVLDPLLRRTDRAAWRANAFILAMNGDAAGADKIAAGMMGGFGTALSPFFRRLPSLAPADKAFAVHFGEIRRTPARIADASVAPPLPVLRSEPGVAVAAAQPARVPQSPGAGSERTPGAIGRGASRTRTSPSRTDARRAAQAAAVQQREATRLAQVEAQQREAQRLAEQETQRVEAQRLADARAQQAREALAARQRETERLAAEQAARETEARRVAEVQARERAAEAERRAAVRAPAPAPLTQAAVPTSAPVASATGQAAPVQTASAGSAPVGAEAVSAPVAPAAAAPAETVAAAQPSAAPPPPGVGREDNVIARIIAGITIPASELGVAPMPGSEPPAAPETAPQSAPAATAVASATPAPTDPGAARLRWVATPQPRPTSRPPEPKPSETKATAEDAKAKAAPAKAGETRAKAAAAAKAKTRPDPAKAEPARTFVQVAGGANVDDLPKSWRALVAKAPAEFKGKQAWTTPLRFTNRLLAGPFKTGGEAQDFVNALGKKGLSAFTFTSEAGQKIAKLPTN